MNIKGSVAFVTGANRGLGREFALELLVRRAAKIYAGVRNPDDFDMEGVVPVRIDVTDDASVAAAAAQCADTTLLINNAGIGRILESTLDPAWLSHPGLAGYSASKSAAWTYTNTVRAELRLNGTQVLGLHVGFLDTDLTRGIDLKKSDPRDVAAQTLQALAAGQDEVIADEGTWALKKSLSTGHALYLEPSRLG